MRLKTAQRKNKRPSDLVFKCNMSCINPCYKPRFDWAFFINIHCLHEVCFLTKVFRVNKLTVNVGFVEEHA